LVKNLIFIIAIAEQLLQPYPDQRHHEPVINRVSLDE